MKKVIQIDKVKNTTVKLYSKFSELFENIWSWLKKNGHPIAVILTFILLYISVYSIIWSVNQSNLNSVEMAKSNVVNLVASGNLDVALRVYKNASLKELRNKPLLSNPFTWLFPRYNLPNRESLWNLIRSELDRHAKIREDEFINLSYVDLRNVKLAGCDFSFVNFYKADLRGADLRGCDFSKAFLYETDLRGCNLESFSEENDQLTKLNIEYFKDIEKHAFDEAKRKFLKQIGSSLVENYKRFLVDRDQVKKWIEQLKSDRRDARYYAICALDQLDENQKTESVYKSLYDLLINEITIEINGIKYITTNVSPIKDSLTDQKSFLIPFNEYFTKLLITVAQLKDTTYLKTAVNFISGKYVKNKVIRDVLVNIGEPIVDPLIETLYQGTPSLKIAAVEIFKRMLSPKQLGYTLKEEICLKIKNSLTRALEDNIHPKDSLQEWKEIEKEYSKYFPGKNPELDDNKWFQKRKQQKANLRIFIIQTLVKIKDENIIPILEEFSKNDPYIRKAADGKIKYPIRRVARIAIENIRQNKEK